MIGQTPWSISTEHCGCSTLPFLLSLSLFSFRWAGVERRAAVFLVSVLPPAERRSVRSLYLQQPLVSLKVSVTVCVCEIKASPEALLWGPCSISIGNRPDRPGWRATGLPEARLSFFWGTQLKQFLHWEKHPCVLYRLYAVFSILRPVVRAGFFWSVGQLLGRYAPTKFSSVGQSLVLL